MIEQGAETVIPQQPVIGFAPGPLNAFGKEGPCTGAVLRENAPDTEHQGIVFQGAGFLPCRFGLECTQSNRVGEYQVGTCQQMHMARRPFFAPNDNFFEIFSYCRPIFALKQYHQAPICDKIGVDDSQDEDEGKEHVPVGLPEGAGVVAI